MLLWSKVQIRYCKVYGSALRKWVVPKDYEYVNGGGSPMIEACPPEAGHMRVLAAASRFCPSSLSPPALFLKNDARLKTLAKERLRLSEGSNRWTTWQWSQRR